MKDFTEYKAEKEGRTTPKACVENLLQGINMGEVDNVVYVARCKDGEIKCGYSEGNHLTLVGLLEVGKAMVIQTMEGEE